MDIRTIYNLIECRRIELNTLVSMYGIRDERVLEKSVQLDRILNVYIRRRWSEETSSPKQQILMNHDGLGHNDYEHRRELSISLQVCK